MSEFFREIVPLSNDSLVTCIRSLKPEESNGSSAMIKVGRVVKNIRLLDLILSGSPVYPLVLL